tara:strand:- start:11 stop:766 length:756 start_codon:yes stop_codon:yes gene_type:complete
MEKNYCDTSKIIIERSTKEIVYNIVKKKHYAKTWTASSDIYAVYYKSGEHKFFGGDDLKLIGCVIYGNPVGFRVVKSICEELIDIDVLELKRLWIEDDYGKNIESYCIAQTLKMLKKDSPQTKVVISYADRGENHKGIIYRASNWLYQGYKIGRGSSYMYKYPGTDEWLTDRAIGEQLGSNALPNVLKKVPDMEWKIKYRKHRYIYFLCSKKEKKRLLKILKHPIRSYGWVCECETTCICDWEAEVKNAVL